MAEPSEREKELAAAVGRIPSGLFILTARHGTAESGMLASWVQQCSFEPWLISVAVRRGRPMSAWLHREAPFAINVLGEGQNRLLSHFGKGFALDEPAFEGIAVERIGESAPLLVDALACLDCRVQQVIEIGGDHDLLIGRVVAGKLRNQDRPATHVRKSGAHY